MILSAVLTSDNRRMQRTALSRHSPDAHHSCSGKFNIITVCC